MENKRYEMRFAGSGGQGVILASVILAEAAVIAGLRTVQSQAYGPEARGGVSKAAKFYMPSLLREVRAIMHTLNGNTLARVPSYIYNLEDPQEFEQFVHGQTKEIEVYGTGKCVRIDTQKRLGITLSQLGTSRATAIGAYCFALHALDC